ncbi:hypothetical protein [Lentzea sp. NBRC 102530]|uniref:hypothetical protein n=1 Tax=Lentzea sp. NBRC 102530 TaxID=3032201 RepID=UPI002554CDE2|nr:hypothetical protein [Lentzea sp. NBRC 102530]
MTTSVMPALRSPVVRHGAEMLVAMLVGMALLGPLWTPEGVELAALWMATSMSVPMALWMRYRGHGRIVEMCAAMVVPYVVLLVPYWAGLVSADVVELGGHVLMLPTMAFVLVRYPHAHTEPSTNPVLRFLGDRWPSVLALAVTIDFWAAPVVPPVWTLLLCQVAYLFWARRAPAVQLVVFGLYVLLGAAVLVVSPYFGVLLIALGWAAHAVWDLVHHVRDAVVPRWWAEGCGVFDLVIAVTILMVWF